MCADSSEGDGLIAHHWSISPLAEDLAIRAAQILALQDPLINSESWQTFLAESRGHRAVPQFSMAFAISGRCCDSVSSFQARTIWSMLGCWLGGRQNGNSFGI
jgi:hypothetical protein